MDILEDLLLSYSMILKALGKKILKELSSNKVLITNKLDINILKIVLETRLSRKKEDGWLFKEKHFFPPSYEAETDVEVLKNGVHRRQ